jgi:quinoprotein glucose dehydrogenase
MQATPILVEGKLLICTPFSEVVALDPGTGKQSWRFDPKIPSAGVFPANKFNCRGVATWTDASGAGGATCRVRVFAATNDARVVALDLDTGRPCAGFDGNGEVKIDPGMELKSPGEFQITSAPVVIGDVVVVGSAIGDNQRVVAPAARCGAFDAHGAARWSWDPCRAIRRIRRLRPGAKATRRSAANVWAPMSVDSSVGSSSCRRRRPAQISSGFAARRQSAREQRRCAQRRNGRAGVGLPDRASRCVGLRHAGTTTLATLDLEGGQRDVVIQPTKQGFIFVLDRDTGLPVLRSRASRSARRRRGRSAVAHAAVSEPHSAAGAAADLAGRRVRADTMGSRCMP